MKFIFINWEVLDYYVLFIFYAKKLELSDIKVSHLAIMKAKIKDHEQTIPHLFVTKSRDTVHSLSEIT